MSKYTKGPWRAHCNDLSEGYRPVGDDGVRYWDVGPSRSGEYRGEVCTVHAALNIGGISLEERDANARLIAAAPDLLEALKNIVNSIEVHDDRAVHMALDAIAKAEGRS